jgi:hypothetical protein
MRESRISPASRSIFSWSSAISTSALTLI